MMNKNENTEKKTLKAHVNNLIIVDESRSMTSLRDATLSGINETIETIRNAQHEYADHQDHTLTVVTFNSRGIRVAIDNVPINLVARFDTYSPRASTPLYDAMGQSLTDLRNRIKGDPEATAVVTVLTDGLENNSREWGPTALRKLIEELKGQGWTFSYIGSAHNVKEVSDLLSIENVAEFSHDATGTSNIWSRERSARRNFFAKLNAIMVEEDVRSEEMVAHFSRLSHEYYGNRVSPDLITELAPNEIFVFGSDRNGVHAGGAAALAVQRFGAIRGQGEGLQGHCYAIPTMEGLPSMADAIGRFTNFAKAHPELRFLVTRIGCGVAGYRTRTVAPLFGQCVELENVVLPSDFWVALGLKNF